MNESQQRKKPGSALTTFFDLPLSCFSLREEWLNQFKIQDIYVAQHRLYRFLNLNNRFDIDTILGISIFDVPP